MNFTHLSSFSSMSFLFPAFLFYSGAGNDHEEGGGRDGKRKRKRETETETERGVHNTVICKVQLIIIAQFIVELSYF